MNLFYEPALTPELSGTVISLDAEESNHCTRVLRMRMGDSIHLTDGRGNLYSGSLVSEHPKHCEVAVEFLHATPKKPYRLHIAIAPTKSIDRFEWFLEKATEIGIDEITPLLCERSERTNIRIDRLQKILVSAMKQSMNLHLPILNHPLHSELFISQVTGNQKYIGYIEEKQEVHLKQLMKPADDVVLMIGPEGDFTTREVDLAQSQGFICVSLGDSRLRTETAGIVGCMIVNLGN